MATAVRTLQGHRAHKDHRKRHQKPVLDLTPRCLPEVGLAHVEHIVQTVGVLQAAGLIHRCKCCVQVGGDVLADTLFEQIADRLIEEFVLISEV